MKKIDSDVNLSEFEVRQIQNFKLDRVRNFKLDLFEGSQILEVQTRISDKKVRF